MIEPLTRPSRRVYEASHGKRVILAVLFLLLSPFFVSLGPMIWLRFRHGLVGDVGGLAIFFLSFALMMLLIGGQLMHSIRSRVELDETTFSFVLPRIWRGIPLLSFDTREIGYDQVQAVETRSEVFGGRIAAVLLKSTRIKLRNGETIVLGAVNEANPDKAFPFPEIGAEIAQRAGINLRDFGVVRRSVARRALGYAATAVENEVLSAAEISVFRRRHRWWMRALVGAVGLLLAGGVVIDVLTAPTTNFADITGAPSTLGPRSGAGAAAKR
jgi:hypothetical protein